jgi:hypothetical protein
VHATTLGIAPAVVTQVEEDAVNFSIIIANISVFRDYSKQTTEYKNLMRDGNPSGAPIGAIAPAPATITFPNPPLGNIFGRVRALVQTIKNNPNITPAIEQDLGILGADIDIDLPAMKPDINIKLQAGQPLLKWKKNRMQGIKIFVDRGTGYQFLALDTQPDYLDTHPLPPAGQTATWKYKAVYVFDDAEVGQYSDEDVVVVKANL